MTNNNRFAHRYTVLPPEGWKISLSAIQFYQSWKRLWEPIKSRHFVATKPSQHSSVSTVFAYGAIGLRFEFHQCPVAGTWKRLARCCSGCHPGLPIFFSKKSILWLHRPCDNNKSQMLFLYQYTFTMHRLSVYNITQWWSQYHVLVNSKHCKLLQVGNT